ncbi:MAG: hypothetical protein Greene041639_467 [Parcubacteria group bacterium Greene0416_39]|nr:MAG: hypothetical protein Greene041639_467 [Parcubacteria group bacterium Greene0416_39]
MVVAEVWVVMALKMVVEVVEDLDRQVALALHLQAGQVEVREEQRHLATITTDLVVLPVEVVQEQVILEGIHLLAAEAVAGPEHTGVRKEPVLVAHLFSAVLEVDLVVVWVKGM